MSTNPTQTLLRQLGLSPTDRVLIVHADDVGMCQATLTAYERLLEVGLMTTASVMVPCPWFPAVADFCRKHPEVDMGVHLTLNCEWNHYRWRPLTTTDPANGLLDDEGYFPRQQQAIWEHASWETVRLECEAQVSKARSAGIDITHLDDHMLVLAHPKLLSSYLEWALVQGLPPRVAYLDHPPQNAWEQAQQTAVDQTESAGMPVVHGFGLPLDQPLGQTEMFRHILGELPAGFSLLVTHPAVDTPELRAIAPDWASRVANYETLMDQMLLNEVRRLGIHLMGFRPFRTS